MKKMTYKYSNGDYGHVITPKWNLFIEAGCNYTKAVKEYALKLGLITYISYEKMTEIIYWAHGIKISRETLYKFKKDNFEGFVSKIRKQLSEMYKEQKIEFSNVLSFDEQYVREDRVSFSIISVRTCSQSLLCGISPDETVNPVME